MCGEGGDGWVGLGVDVVGRVLGRALGGVFMSGIAYYETTRMFRNVLQLVFVGYS